MEPILHVARKDAWEAAHARGEYAIPDGPDPFIHACSEEQLPGVLERFYRGVPRDELVLLEVDTTGLPLEVEAASDGFGDFPHVYGPIPTGNVVAVRAVP